MKRVTVVLFILLAFHSVSKSQSDTLSTDAIFLALRSQEGIHLDSSLAWEYQEAIEKAYLVSDSMRYIHVFPDFVLNEIYVITYADWAAVWDSGGVWTGEDFIDSIGFEFGLEYVEVGSFSYFLNYNSIFNPWKLGQLYEQHPDISYGRPNYYIGDGNNIEGFQKNDSTYLVFSIGLGDCMSGCIYHKYWYIQLGEYEGELIGEMDSYDPPAIFFWNIPARYAATVFQSVNEIFESALYSPHWWVRRHTAEVMWRLVTRDGPWVGEDDYQIWQQLNAGILDSLDNAISILEYLIENDEDEDVVESAQYALTKIENADVSVDNNSIFPKQYKLYQPYPNPFNPTTTLRFNIGVGDAIMRTLRLDIYDITGRLVETLVEGELDPGEHEIAWNGSNHPSGVYFVRLQSGEYVETQKLVLLK